MKILHLIDSGGLYGAEKMVLSLAQQQLKNDLEPLILSVGLPDDAEKAIERACGELALPCIAWRIEPGLNLKACLEIIDWGKVNGYSILHSHGYKFNILLALVRKKRRGIAFLTTIHGYTASRIFSKLFAYKLIDCILSFRADRVVVVSNALRKVLLAKDNVRFIPNGIDAENKIDVASLSDIPQDRFIVVVGRLSKEKAVEKAIGAFTRIADRIPDLSLLIIGEGPERAELEGVVKKSTASRRIIFTGYRDNAIAYIKNAEALMISSDQEGLPLSLLEAMCVQTPVVSTPVGEIPNVLGGGQYGYLSSDTTETCLAQALLELVDNPVRASRKARLANNRFLEEYTAHRMSQRYLGLYQEILRI